MLIQSKRHFLEMWNEGLLKESIELSTPPDYVQSKWLADFWLRHHAPPSYVFGYILAKDTDDWFQTRDCSVVFCPKLAAVCDTPYAASTFNFIAYGRTPAKAAEAVMIAESQYS